MLKSLLLPGFVLLVSIAPRAFPVQQSQPWLGVHVLMTSRDKTIQLTEVIDQVADLGINVIVAEINYGYEYESHPDLRAASFSSKEHVEKLVAECRRRRIRLIPQFQCLGLQSWSGRTYPLLVVRQTHIRPVFEFSV